MDQNDVPLLKCAKERLDGIEKEFVKVLSKAV